MMNPYPGPNSVLIVDNCATHKNTAVHEAVEAAGTCLLFIVIFDVADVRSHTSRVCLYIPPHIFP